jgi:very-short-patch-repair endonuclease
MQLKSISKKKAQMFGYNIDAKTQAKLRSYQRRMRKKPTVAENRFYLILLDYFGFSPLYKNRKRIKQHVVRQKIFWFKITDGFKGYIADFWLPKNRIVFEIDGKTHDSRYSMAKDYTRSSFIENKGIPVVRVNNENTKDDKKCLEIIQNAINGVVYQENKNKFPPKIEIFRRDELEMQKEFIEAGKITRYTSSDTEDE